MAPGRPVELLLLPPGFEEEEEEEEEGLKKRAWPRSAILAVLP